MLFRSHTAMLNMTCKIITEMQCSVKLIKTTSQYCVFWFAFLPTAPNLQFFCMLIYSCADFSL